MAMKKLWTLYPGQNIQGAEPGSTSAARDSISVDDARVVTCFPAPTPTGRDRDSRVDSTVMEVCVLEVEGGLPDVDIC